MHDHDDFNKTQTVSFKFHHVKKEVVEIFTDVTDFYNEQIYIWILTKVSTSS